MPEEFRISDGMNSGKTCLLRVGGQLDARAAAQLLAHCSAICKAEKNLVLNLAEVSFIASSGIGALLALVEQFRESGCSVRFVSLSAAVDSVIRLLNLDQFLTIDPTEADAVSALEA
jgi:anti-anti-sigma factor